MSPSFAPGTPPYALQHDTTTARTAYQDFFALWTDADLDISILKQAKAKYAKLKAMGESLLLRQGFVRAS